MFQELSIFSIIITLLIAPVLQCTHAVFFILLFFYFLFFFSLSPEDGPEVIIPDDGGTGPGQAHEGAEGSLPLVTAPPVTAPHLQHRNHRCHGTAVALTVTCTMNFCYFREYWTSWIIHSWGYFMTQQQQFFNFTRAFVHICWELFQGWDLFTKTASYHINMVSWLHWKN